MIPWRMGRWRAVYEYPEHHQMKSIDSDRTTRDVQTGRIWQEISTG
jgi:hypothetical protein